MPRRSACSVTSRPRAMTSLRLSTVGAFTITILVVPSSAVRDRGRRLSSGAPLVPVAPTAVAARPAATRPPMAASLMGLCREMRWDMCPPEWMTRDVTRGDPDNTESPYLSRGSDPACPNSASVWPLVEDVAHVTRSSRQVLPRARPAGRVRGPGGQRQAPARSRPRGRGAVRLPGRGHRGDAGHGRERGQDAARPAGPRRRARAAESTLARQGEDRILVELPGVTSDEEAQAAEEQIGQTAKLTIHEVVGVAEPDAEPSKKDNQVLPTDQGDTLEVGPTVIAGEEITGASSVQRDQSVEYVVAIDFNGKGGSTWADITGTAACNPSGDPKRASRSSSTARSSPHPRSTRPSAATSASAAARRRSPATSRPTAAKDLAALIEGGSLPARGDRSSDRRSARPWVPTRSTPRSRPVSSASILTGALHHLRLPVRRPDGHDRARVVRPDRLRHARRPRRDADPAGPRRLRARHRHGDRRQRARLRESEGGVRRRSRARGCAARSTTGFNKAWTAIIDSNVTTLLAAGLLFFLASGPIKGFGVTLSHRCPRVDDLRADHHAGALRPVGVHQVRPATTLAQRYRQRRPGPHVARHGLARPDEASRHLARHLRRSPPRRDHRHRHPGPRPRCRVHRWSASSTTR